MYQERERKRWGNPPYWWMAVTPDKYELPIAVCDTAEDLAAAMGVSQSAIFTSIIKGLSGRNRRWRVIKIRRE